MPKRSRVDYISDLDDQSTVTPQQPLMHVLGKRHNTFCDYENQKKRARTDEYTMKLENRIAKLEDDMTMMRNAMEMAGIEIINLRQENEKIKYLMEVQRCQMERQRLNNNVSVY
jgi:hypothetical protein